MGRMPTFRPNYDALRRLNLSDLKRENLLSELLSNRSNSVFDMRVTDSIRITVRLDYILPSTGYVELSYRYEGESVISKFDLVQTASNLGKRGGIWYFICPLTRKRCRVLYSSGKYFVSRHALKGIMYESQTWSKQYRSIANIYGPNIKLNEALEELHKPYAKKHYRGKPTPKAKKVQKLDTLQDRVGFT